MCPGAKDYVSVRIDGIKQQKQKRLLLVNLNELYTQFKEKSGEKIGISKFCELRPKWCITVGSKGTHSVCVCQIHQNIKLMLAPIAAYSKLDYHKLMDLVVCDTSSEECMIHRCPKCPGKPALFDHFINTLGPEYDEDDTVSFQQWVHTDSTTLVQQQLPFADFLDKLVEEINNVTVHHFISKAQATYLSDSKDNISENVAIVMLDFAENYSFVVQDAVQGFHWDNSQTTLHPFAVYYLRGGELQKHCICCVSDCMKHDTAAVYSFQSIVLEYLKHLCPSIDTIKYFSDGAASQYKNYKNFANLCHHEEDFGLKAEWHFLQLAMAKVPVMA